MPAGPGLLGYVYFAAAKFAGYTAYAVLLNRSKAIAQSACRPAAPKSVGYDATSTLFGGAKVAVSSNDRVPAAWKSGLVRTFIGVAVGVVVGLLFWKIIPQSAFWDQHGDVIFMIGLVPIRVLEWSAFLWLMYRHCSLAGKTKAKFVVGGIATSFILDFVGILAAWVLPGGFWVC